jgi:NADH:ubiquinone oxidoreductase subunit 4 (subunit M)
MMSFGNWVHGVFVEQAFNEDLNNLFFNEFFTIMILADVFILLMSFQYTERYSQLIRNTGFIISTILLRLSFSVSGLTSILLIISGILFGLIILLIYNLIERDKKTL